MLIDNTHLLCAQFSLKSLKGNKQKQINAKTTKTNKSKLMHTNLPSFLKLLETEMSIFV